MPSVVAIQAIPVAEARSARAPKSNSRAATSTPCASSASTRGPTRVLTWR
ncbi:Uncharacterised protein [Bordetella pertussis]|nr:Uncharacterised protein [Bordetella pertussis]CFV97376.1 Uncharacterised protein [Bordetella pertussis]CFW30575.1 Uncharacterised protein [Bordetella pertussis]